jgi:hypothetical protein
MQTFDHVTSMSWFQPEYSKSACRVTDMAIISPSFDRGLQAKGIKRRHGDATAGDADSHIRE